jgi:hypothetical protein
MSRNSCSTKITRANIARDIRRKLAGNPAALEEVARKIDELAAADPEIGSIPRRSIDFE